MVELTGVADDEGQSVVLVLVSSDVVDWVVLDDEHKDEDVLGSK